MRQGTSSAMESVTKSRSKVVIHKGECTLRTKITAAAIFPVLFLCLSPPLYGQPKDVRIFCEQVKGNTYWLKIDVVRVQELIGGTDATNVYSDGTVYYRGTFGLRQTQSTSAEDFAEEVRLKAQTAVEDDPLAEMQVRVWERGSKVVIHGAKAAKKEVRIDITEVGKSKSRIRFKFPDKNDYTIEKMREMFEIAFAENKAELRGSEETAQIDLGMTIEEVIKLLGKPKIRMNLGTKTVLTYDDLKLIFKDGKLKDVQ